jgi:hypothetical protein
LQDRDCFVVRHLQVFFGNGRRIELLEDLRREANVGLVQKRAGDLPLHLICRGVGCGVEQNVCVNEVSCDHIVPRG